MKNKISTIKTSTYNVENKSIENFFEEKLIQANNHLNFILKNNKNLSLKK